MRKSGNGKGGRNEGKLRRGKVVGAIMSPLDVLGKKWLKKRKKKWEIDDSENSEGGKSENKRENDDFGGFEAQDGVKYC